MSFSTDCVNNVSNVFFQIPNTAEPHNKVFRGTSHLVEFFYCLFITVKLLPGIKKSNIVRTIDASSLVLVLIIDRYTCSFVLLLI